MKMRELGQLKTEIAPIGIGAMSFSDFYGQATTDQANEVLKMALDLGTIRTAIDPLLRKEVAFYLESEKINDEESSNLSFKISQKIQTDMTYPGQVKVTVIRETRSVNIAK